MTSPPWYERFVPAMLEGSLPSGPKGSGAPRCGTTPCIPWDAAAATAGVASRAPRAARTSTSFRLVRTDRAPWIGRSGARRRAAGDELLRQARAAAFRSGSLDSGGVEGGRADRGPARRRHPPLAVGRTCRRDRDGDLRRRV